MKVTIVSPEKTLFEGEADGVKLPGEMGRFEVLKGHAPIISSLTEGEVVCEGSQPFGVKVSGGFVEVALNEVTICVETL